MAIKNKVDFDRVDDLIKFSMGMMAGEDGSKLIKKYQNAIDNITPFDMVALEEKQIEKGVDVKAIKKDIEKIINVLKPALDSYEWEKPGEGHPVYYYMKENRKLEDLLGNTKKTIKSLKFEELTQKEFADKLKEFEQNIEELSKFNCHYTRKENILFPYLEASWDYTRPLQVMWSIHDDIRTGWKEVLAGVREEKDLTPEIDKKLGRLFLMAYRMVHKEEQIIFPLAMEALTEADWAEMLLQEPEVGYFKIAGPGQKELNASQQLLIKTGSSRKVEKTKADGDIKDAVLEFATGKLSKEQLELIFNYLPVDITYVDENDQVRFFSDPPERIFPRSPAIIGRKVHNCHPPESVHIVEQIVEDFKAGKRDKARFWLTINERFILIDYFCLRDGENKYRGVIEVTQDITEIQELEGEKRLLD